MELKEISTQCLKLECLALVSKWSISSCGFKSDCPLFIIILSLLLLFVRICNIVNSRDIRDPGHISSLFIIFDKKTFNIYAYLKQ